MRQAVEEPGLKNHIAHPVVTLNFFCLVLTGSLLWSAQNGLCGFNPRPKGHCRDNVVHPASVHTLVLAGFLERLMIDQIWFEGPSYEELGWDRI